MVFSVITGGSQEGGGQSGRQSDSFGVIVQTEAVVALQDAQQESFKRMSFMDFVVGSLITDFDGH